MTIRWGGPARARAEQALFDLIEKPKEDPGGLVYVTRQPDGRWQRRPMPEWYFQALFPDTYAQRREEVSVRVYQQLEPWGA